MIYSILTISQYVLASLSAILLFYYIFIFGRIVFYKKIISKKKHNNNNALEYQYDISVIVNISNETLDDITHFLKKFFEKEPVDVNYELILVVYSVSNTARFLIANYQKQYTNVKVVELFNESKYIGGDKYPIAVGIKSAKSPMSCIQKFILLIILTNG